MTAEVAISNKRTRGMFLLAIPLWLVERLLLPPALLALPLIFLACLVGRVDPFRAVAFLWRILADLKGTHIELETCDRSVSIQVA